VKDLPGIAIQLELSKLTQRKLAKYKIAVCLENSYEPNYFTEKFVNGAL
jgi:hypothetical protein